MKLKQGTDRTGFRSIIIPVPDGTSWARGSPSPERQSLLDPPVHVALHIEPGWLEPADRLPVVHQVLLSLHVLVPGVRVVPGVSQGQHGFVRLQLVPQLGQEGDSSFLRLHAHLLMRREQINHSETFHVSTTATDPGGIPPETRQASRPLLLRTLAHTPPGVQRNTLGGLERYLLPSTSMTSQTPVFGWRRYS